MEVGTRVCFPFSNVSSTNASNYFELQIFQCLDNAFSISRYTALLLLTLNEMRLFYSKKWEMRNWYLNTESPECKVFNTKETVTRPTMPLMTRLPSYRSSFLTDLWVNAPASFEWSNGNSEKFFLVPYLHFANYPRVWAELWQHVSK